MFKEQIMRTVTTSECNTFEEVRKLFERAFSEIDDINFVIAPAKEKYLKQIAEATAKVEKAIAAKLARETKNAAKAKALADATAIVDRAKAVKKVAEETEAKREAELKAAKKVIAESKKGFVSMKLLISIVVFLSLFVGVAHGVYQTTDINYDIASNPEQLSRYLRDVFANQVGNTFVFTPGTEPSSADTTEGMVYYKDSSDTLQLRTESAWVDIDVSGASSLDAAYTIGQAIGVDAGAMTLTTTDSADTAAFAIVHGEADAYPAFEISNAGTDPTIEITTGGTGEDIKGTAGWSVDKTGIGTFLSLVLENSETIDNTDDGEITFSDGSDDTAISWSGTTLEWSSDTAIVTVDWGLLDSHIGLDDITFDAAGSDNTITLAGSTTGKDLTIQQTVSAADASLILQSSGTGLDALSLITSNATGDIKIFSADSLDIDSVDDITIDTSNGTYTLTIGGATDGKYISTVADTYSMIAVDTVTIQNTEASKDITVDSAAGSVIIDGGEATATAVKIAATATAGGIDVDAGTGGIDVLTTGVISIDAAAVSNISVASLTTDENLTLSVTGATASSLILSSAGTGDDAVDLNATAGGLDVDTAGSIALTSAEDSADSISLISTLGGIDITCSASDSEAIDITNTAGPIIISSTHDADLSITITTSDTAGQILIDSGDITADGIDIDAAGGIDIDVVLEHFTIDLATASKDFRVDSALGSIYIEGGKSAAAAVSLVASGGAGGINMDAKTGGIDLDAVSGDITLDTTGNSGDVITLINATGTGTGAIALTATAGGITIDGGSAQDIAITSTGKAVTITSTETNADAIALIATTGAGGVTATSGSGGINLNASVNQAVNIASGTSTGTVTIGGSGAQTITIGDTGIETINIGAGGTGAKTITIGDVTTGSSLGLLAGTGNIVMNGSVATTYTIGNASQTGTIKLGESDATMILNLGTGTGAHTIHIGDGATGAMIITMGSLAAASATTIEAGTGTLVIGSAGTGGDAINIDTTAGGIDIDMTGAADGEDFAVNTVSSIQLVASQDSVADAIKLHASGAAGGVDIDSGTGGIIATSTGILTLAASDDISITVTSGTAGEDILITQTGGNDSSITLTTAGTGEDAIGIIASTGGINITASAGEDGNDIDISNTGGSVNITATEDVASAIYLRENSSSTSGTILIKADSGTSVSAGAESIALLSDLGGIGLTATGVTSTAAINLNAAAGGITMACVKDFLLTVSSAATDDDLTLQTAGNDDSHIILLADGSSVDALTLTADLGGIEIDAVEVINIDLDGGTAGTSLITITNDDGTDEGAIELTSTVGGIDLNAAADKNITLNAGQILVTAEHDVASAISLITNTGGSETIVITNTLGTGADAINIDVSAAAGGIDIDTANGAFAVTAAGGVNGDITLIAGDVMTLTAADPIGILVSTGAAKTHNYVYFGIGYEAATTITVSGGGSEMVCTGLAAGVADAGSTQGYTMLDDAADTMLFSFRMPDDCVITDTDTDFVLDAYLHEQLSGTAVNINIYEFGNTTPILTDTYVTVDGVAAGWVTMTTKSTGFGADTDLDADDTLIIKLDTVGDANDVDVYGFRLKYKTGLAATQ